MSKLSGQFPDQPPKACSLALPHRVGLCHTSVSWRMEVGFPSSDAQAIWLFQKASPPDVYLANGIRTCLPWQGKACVWEGCLAGAWWCMAEKKVDAGGVRSDWSKAHGHLSLLSSMLHWLACFPFYHPHLFFATGISPSCFSVEDLTAFLILYSWSQHTPPSPDYLMVVTLFYNHIFSLFSNSLQERQRSCG